MSCLNWKIRKADVYVTIPGLIAMANSLLWVKNDLRTIFSMFFEHDYQEQDWYCEMDFNKNTTADPTEPTILTKFDNLIRQSHVVAVYGNNGHEYCEYLFQDPQGCIHAAFDDDGGVLVLGAFADEAAANAAFVHYTNFNDKDYPWVSFLARESNKPMLEIAGIDSICINNAIGNLSVF
jgi:hypothetical protein